MSESILEGILEELQGIRNEMATKSELAEIKQTMATKSELEEFKKTTKSEFEEIKQTMATKSELEELRNDMNVGFAELKKTLDEHHSENIRADEKLLELIGTTNEQLKTHDIKIDILNRNQLELQAELCKMKSG